MTDKKVKISNILESLIPGFIQSDNPDFIEFLNQYYISQEHNYGTVDIAENIPLYKNIGTLAEIETVRAQTVTPTGQLTPPQVVVVTEEILTYDDVINVNHTKGFPDTYGLIKIDDEIISYTGKTATSFTGCIRGFSGVSKVESVGNPEFLTFSESDADEHIATSVVVNLNFEFLGQFYNKFKTQFLPGVEKREFADGLSVENILSRAKDFYATKGTDISLDILFKVLFGKAVQILKPFNDTISASDADWIRADEVMVEVISGNPINLISHSLYEGDFNTFPTNPSAFGTISNVEELFVGRKRYYKIRLSKEVGNKKFKINTKTKVTASTESNSVVSVDSTVGFGNTGFFYFIDSLGDYTKAEYKSKSYNQFFGCVGVTTSLQISDPIISDNFVFGYENNDISKVCQMRVVGSIAGLSSKYKNTKFLNAGDTLGVRSLGEKRINDPKFDSWFHNNISYVGISSINIFVSQIETIDDNYLNVNDDIHIYEKFTTKELNPGTTWKVTKLIDSKRFEVKSNNPSDPDINFPPSGSVSVGATVYEIKKNLSYVDENLGFDSLISGIQNSFTDQNDNTLIAFSGYPTGGIASTDRSQTFLTSGISTAGTGINIPNHGFLNGEKVYYEPIPTDKWDSTTETFVKTTEGIYLGGINIKGDAFSSNEVGIDTGVYYIKKIDDNNIRLSLNEIGVFNDNTLWNVYTDRFPTHNPIGLGDSTSPEVTHKLIPYLLWEGNGLGNQNNFKRILKNTLPAEEKYDIIGPIGVGLNGVELHSPKSEDFYYYGQIDSIDVIDSGDENYDAINPPTVSIADTAGNQAQGIVHISEGKISEIVLQTSGWDYGSVPGVSITGGNGIDGECEAKMRAIDYSVTLREQDVNTSTAPSIVGNTISIASTVGSFTINEGHRFITGERVIYQNSTGGSTIGVGRTHVGMSTDSLVNGAIYYVVNNNSKNISLTITEDSALKKIHLIDFLDDGVGSHTLTAIRKRQIIDRLVVKNPGSGYGNNKIEVKSQKYPPDARSGILTTFTGISTQNDYIFAKNHNFSSGETVKYTSNSVIGGLISGVDYVIDVIDNDRFKISSSKTDHNNKVYINLNSNGVGIHTFNYPEIKVNIEGSSAVGVGSTTLPSYYTATAYAEARGRIDNIFLTDGGVSYGSSDVLNYSRQPTVKVNTGENAVVGCIVDSSGRVASAYVVYGGTGYTTPPILEIIGTGRFAKLSATVENGEITEVQVIRGGSGYTEGVTNVKVLPGGFGANFNANIHKWNINTVERYKSILQLGPNQEPNVYKQTVQLPSDYSDRGNKIAAFTATKQLRLELQDNLRINSANQYEEKQNANNNDLLIHSKIIGWAYDGNPIYGPYGTKGGQSARLLSSYEKQNIPYNQDLRPNEVNGYFIEDYFFNANNGDLDEYNGRYCITPEYPNGTYAYFASIDTSGEPKFPYLPIRHRNRSDEFNYNAFTDQTDKYINIGEYRRNVQHYGINEENRRYPLLGMQIDSNAYLNIENTKKSGISTIVVQEPGTFYKVGEKLSFSGDTFTGANIREVLGKNLVSIATSEIIEKNLTFSVVNDNVTAFSTLPHSYKSGDFVQIAGISSAQYEFIEGDPHTIGVNTSIISTLSVAIGATTVTGITTFISMSEPTASARFNVDDVIEIEDEQMLILAVDHVNSRYRVRRYYNSSTPGAHDASRTIKKLPKEFTFKSKISIPNKSAEIPKKYNFDAEFAVGIGSTASRVQTGYVGVGNTWTYAFKTIPERAIYLPGHKFLTGDKISLVSIGSTLNVILPKHAPHAFAANPITQQFDLSTLEQPFYAVKLSDEYIGISTSKVGFQTSYVYFINATGKDHRIETIVNNVTGRATKVEATVTLDEEHSLRAKDRIRFKIEPKLTQRYNFKFNDANRVLTSKEVGFTTDKVGVGIGSTSSQFIIPKHSYRTGDIVVYNSTDPISPLVNDGVYAVVRVSDDEIKLAENQYDATKLPYEEIKLTNAGGGTSPNGSLGSINPRLLFYRGNTISLGIGDPSLLGYKINFYYDDKFEARADLSSEDVELVGDYGDGSVDSVLKITVGSSFPSTLYYRVEGHGDQYTSTYPSATNRDVPNHSNIRVIDSSLNGFHNITGVGETTFKLNLVGLAETTFYDTAGFNTAFYSTTSETESGGIYSIEITDAGFHDSIPKIVSVGTTTGSEAIFFEDSLDIGQILSVNVENQGLEFNPDTTLTPKADANTVLKLRDVYTLNSVGIITGGKNYTSAPDVIAIGNTAIQLSATIAGNSVEKVKILANDTGLSKNIRFIPVNNSNGVGIISASSAFKVNTLNIRAPIAGFTTANPFPFAKGDEIFVENVITTDGDGYNSSDYGFKYFTVTGINTIGGAESVEYNIAGFGNTGGAMDTSNLFGRIIKKDDLASFEGKLDKVSFVEGEKVNQINGTAVGIVAKDGWNTNAQTLKLRGVKGIFENKSKVLGSINGGKSIIQNVHDFNFDLDVQSVVEKQQNWENDKGKLNLHDQRLHDNDYYQRFSYSIQGEEPYENWKDIVKSLGHISGYKAFSDLEVINGLGTTVGMSTIPAEIQFKVELNNEASVYDRYFYDLASEDTSNPNLSKIITFDSKVLTDYAESRTNKVLLLADISDQFTGQNRTFTGIHTFMSATQTAVTIVSGGSGSLGPTTGTTYDPSTGVLTIFTQEPHKLLNTNTVSLVDDSITFRCDKDNYGTDHTYPRSTDPASTSNDKLNNGILAIGNTTENSFQVTVNNPTTGGQTVGLHTFTLYTVDKENEVPVAGISTERLFFKTINPTTNINTTTGYFDIPEHEFNLGEQLLYSPNGGGAIQIDNGSGGNTNLPSEVYVINSTDPRDRRLFRLATSLVNANAGIAVTVTGVGSGTEHTFAVPSELATNRTMISIDNVIQSPISFNKGVALGLARAVGIGSTQITLSDTSKVQGNDIIKIKNELIKVNLVGISSGNVLDVTRGVMGTSNAAHAIGAAVTAISGDYRIENGIIHFTDAPYGPIGQRPLTTRSSFSGRSFYRLNYTNNKTFDDISEQFDGTTKLFNIKQNGVQISGIQTNYGIVLVNNIFQDPHHGDGGSSWNISDYRIESPGQQIEFEGTAGAPYVNQGSNTGEVPIGGVINEFDVNPGVGIQSSFTAIAEANVSVGGTILSVGIVTAGGGYLYPPRVSIGLTNYAFDHRFVAAGTNSISVQGGGNLTPTFATYNPTSGVLSLTIPNHGLNTSNKVTIANNSLIFKCSKDNYTTDHAYPRANVDPVSGIATSVLSVETNLITVSIHPSVGVGASLVANVVNGEISSIDVVSPGAGYTTTYQPTITIDPPSPWNDVPLTGGNGSGATMDVVIGVGGSAIQYSLNNPGVGYDVNDVLSLDPVPYSVGAGATSPFQITVKNRHQDKFSGWSFGQLFELDDFSNLFNGFRKSFLITRTVVDKEYYSIIKREGSGIVLANNLLIFINDILQKPVEDYTFTKGTRITFKEPPKPGSKFRMYLYVASTDDYLSVDVEETIKPGDGLTIQQWNDLTGSSLFAQDRRIVYELISSDSVETQTYTGIGIRTDGLLRPIKWSKQKSDTLIDGIKISKARAYLEPLIQPSTNIIQPVGAGDTVIYVKNIYPTFQSYDDVSTNLNNIRIVGQGSTAVVENLQKVTYGGDYGPIVAIGHSAIGTGVSVTKPSLYFDLVPNFDIQSEITRSGLSTGDYFVVQGTNIGAVGGGVTSLGISTNTVVSTGSSFIDNVYYVHHYEHSNTPGIVGFGASTLRVYCNVDQLTGIDTTTLLDPMIPPVAGASGGGYGNYTWGLINVSRSVNTAKVFECYNHNGLVGIETSAQVSRILGLKSILK